MTAIRVGLACLVVVVLFDVVLDGSYIFSALFCPIWFLAVGVWAIARRPSRGVMFAAFLMPIVAALLVGVNFSVQRMIATANGELLIHACEKYREAKGDYPAQLGDLVPVYLSSVPRAKYCCWFSEFRYIGGTTHLLFWCECPPFGRRIYNFETHEWHYLD